MHLRTKICRFADQVNCNVWTIFPLIQNDAILFKYHLPDYWKPGVLVGIVSNTASLLEFETFWNSGI